MTEPFVILPASEVKRLILEAITEAMPGQSAADEKPVSAKSAAQALGTGEQRLRDWCNRGCDACGEKMPSIMTSEERGLKVYLSRAREWMEHHLSPGGCRG
jgi:hypothetical protein